MKFAAGLALALATGAGAHAAPAGFEALFSRFTPQTPGCAVGVESAGAAPMFRGYGSADLEHAVPVTPDTVFEAGSVSKQFTAASILLLAAEGKLALSDDIRKYLPEMPAYERPITIDMLLSHTSGLRDWGDVMSLAGWPRTTRVYANAETLQIAARQRALNYAPGEAYSYTNTGYNLAAIIVRRVSGQSLADFTRDRLFQPLGMTHTAWRDDFRRIVPGRAVAYEARKGGGFEQQMPFENTYGHGGLLTTVGDLLIWNDALTDGKLGPKVTAQLQEQATLTGGRKIAYARGLFVQTWRGEAEVAHSGSTAGYRAWLGRLPARGLSVALLCNEGDVNPTELAHQVVDLYLPPAPAAPSPAATPAADLEALPGLYVDERTGGVLKVAARRGRLGATGVGWLTPDAAGGYAGRGSTFAFSADGVLRHTPDGETIGYRRVTPVTPTADELAALVGTYASDEAGAVLTAELRDGKLMLVHPDRPAEPVIAEPLYRDAFRGTGALIRVIRGADGRVAALRVTGGRIYALDFVRQP